MPYADWRRERMEWNGPEVLERERGENGGEKSSSSTIVFVLNTRITEFSKGSIYITAACLLSARVCC